MNIYDVMGPIMVGPSSSHTAGACRLGLLANRILGAKVARAMIYLHGSFAETYRGHGTDMALLAGLMGWAPDDSRIPEAEKYAQESGLEYSYNKIDLGAGTHPNTVLFKLTAENGCYTEIVGSSIGGGQVLITEIDGFEVKLNGKLPALLVIHVDRPGLIALVGSTMASFGVNIATMEVFRDAKGGRASMILECDNVVPDAAIDIIRRLPNVEAVRFVACVE